MTWNFVRNWISALIEVEFIENQVALELADYEYSSESSDEKRAEGKDCVSEAINS